MRLGVLVRSGTIAAAFVAVACCVTCHAAGPPTGVAIAAIQTASGNYLTVVNGGGLGGPNTGPIAVALHTDATTAGPFETFTMVWLNSTFTQFALQTSDGHYVTAVNGGGLGGANDSSTPVHTDAKTIGIWERMTLNFLPNNQLTIKLPNGRFLTAVNGGGMSGPAESPVQTDAVQPARWGTFTLVTLRRASVSARKSFPEDQDTGQTGPDQDAGECFDKPRKGSNPVSLFLRWKCPPLFDSKTVTADVVTQAALDFLTKYADVWRMENPSKELKRRYAQPDWDVEFRQWNSGVRVFEAEIHISFIGGVPSWVRSEYIPGLDPVNKSAKVSGAQAIEIARKQVATSARILVNAIRADGKPMLGISAAQSNETPRPPRLIYRLTLRAEMRDVKCEIDARTGEVLSANFVEPLSARLVR
jgi:hypothetical protein